MANEQPQWLRSTRALVFSRRGIAIAKGVLAYILAFILIFLGGFDRLNAEPQVLSAMMIVVIAGQPGKAVGSTLGGLILAGGGVLIGSLNFFILAKLRVSPVGQGFVFFAMVYCLAYIKAISLKFFSFSLLAILMSFNGIYTSYVVGKFESTYLFAYLEAYLWGIAVSAFVSLCIFPITSEKELRKLLILSMEHVETFGMLLSRSYLMIITPEEKVVRDKLAQTIRADFGLLMQKLDETTLEVNWSRWSMDDYRYFIGKTRAVQQALISTHSSVTVLERVDDELYRTTFLPKTIHAFNKVRLDLRLTCTEIKVAFGGTSHNGLPRCLWDSYMDVERQVAAVDEQGEQQQDPLEGSRAPANAAFHGAAYDAEQSAQLRLVSERLAAEFESVHTNTGDEPGGDDDHHSDGSKPTATEGATKSPASRPLSTVVGSPQVEEGRLDEKERAFYQQAVRSRGPHALLQDFAAFSELQYDLINKAITGGTLTDCEGQEAKLRVHTPQPSVYQFYGNDYVRGMANQDQKVETSPLVSKADFLSPSSASNHNTQGSDSPLRRRKVVTIQDPVGTPDDDAGASLNGSSVDDNDDVSVAEVMDQKKKDTILTEEAGNHSLIMVYSLLFGINQYVNDLSEFHARVTAKDAKGRVPGKRLHLHLFESLRHPATPATATPDVAEMSLAEALAILEGRSYQKHHVTFWERVHNLRVLALGQQSLFALKTAAAVTVFAMFIYATSTREFFISYSLTGGLLTVVVALAPTLGQSAMTFVLQIAGSAVGYLMGLLFLTIFHNVGGYVYNPYGIVCLLSLYAIPLVYIIYENPKFFALALLGLNGSGVLIVTEWVYRDVYRRPFDTPAYRTGKSLTALAVGVALSAIFQLFIARNPARRTLRKALANVTYSNLAYLTLLQAFVRAVVPADPSHHFPQAAVERVHDELKKRELKIQGELIAMMPLITFAKAEPSLTKKFNASLPLRTIKANQVILDRLREGRAAIGTTRLDEVILRNFVSVLSPYRRRASRITKNVMGACAASLSSKLPLPQDMPLMGRNAALSDFVHDALLLSYRFSKTEEGVAAVKKGDFTRYWFYVLSVTSIFRQLDEMEAVVKDMFGRLEDSLA